MAAFDHWLPLHVGDYLADTMHLSTLQHGIYIRLIMHYWKRRGLPADERSLAQIAGIPTLKFRVHGGPVMALFTPVGVGSESKLLGTLNKKVDTNDGVSGESKPHGVNGVDHVTVPDMAPTLSHKRLDAELARAVGIFEHRKDVATRSAAARRGGKTNGHKSEHLLNGKAVESPTPAPQRARDSTTTTSEESPLTPPQGGKRERGISKPRPTKPEPVTFRCGFGASAVSDMQEAVDYAEPSNPPTGRPQLVSVAGRLVSG
jgi:uncharacterized protein YdaU (DUF1376 family)